MPGIIHASIEGFLPASAKVVQPKRCTGLRERRLLAGAGGLTAARQRLFRVAQRLGR
jgi:hypothetical protein